MYETYLNVRDDIINCLIRFLLKYCCLYAGTIRAFVKKTSFSELEIMNNERKHS